MPPHVAVNSKMCQGVATAPPSKHACGNCGARPRRQPLLAVDLVEMDSTSRTKHEVIKELVDLLAGAGRLGDAPAVEEAVWRREETYSTGFGYGFAVPHCQSNDVDAGSIALVRLRDPVEWGSLDGGSGADCHFDRVACGGSGARASADSRQVVAAGDARGISRAAGTGSGRAGDFFDSPNASSI